MTYPGNDQVLLIHDRFDPALVGLDARVIIADHGSLVCSSESGVDGDGDG